MPDTLRVKALNTEHTFLLKKKAFLKKKILKALKVQKTEIQELQYPSKLNTNHNCYFIECHFIFCTSSRGYFDKLYFEPHSPFFFLKWNRFLPKSEKGEGGSQGW